jgi:hypothetical protein
MLTRKVKTGFGSMYIHVELNDRGQPAGGSISHPGKAPDSRIAQLVKDLSDGLDAALCHEFDGAPAPAEDTEKAAP